MTGNRYTPGHVGTTTIRDVERAMNQVYLGWSNTITGVLIPMGPPPKGVKPPSRGSKVDSALARLLEARKKAKPGTRRFRTLTRAIKFLTKIPTS